MAIKSTADKVATLQKGYTLEGPTIELGAAIIDGEVHKEAPVRLPLSMMNRHGLVAGATGTGKTVTLHMMAEQLSAAGVPVFLADIKGDLSGLATAATGSEKLMARTAGIGQPWSGDHDRVDALGAHREGTAQRAEQCRDQDGDGGGQPPWPVQADLGDGAVAEDRDEVAGEPCHRHLDQTDDAAIAGQEHQAQRDQAKDHGVGNDLDQPEGTCDRRHEQKQTGDNPEGRAPPRHPVVEALAGAGALLQIEVRDSHHPRLAARPSGRTARTATMMMKVSITA